MPKKSKGPRTAALAIEIVEQSTFRSGTGCHLETDSAAVVYEDLGENEQRGSSSNVRSFVDTELR